MYLHHSAAGDCGADVFIVGDCRGHRSWPHDGDGTGLDNTLGRKHNGLAKGNRQRIPNDDLSNDIYTNTFNCVDDSRHQ